MFKEEELRKLLNPIIHAIKATDSGISSKKKKEPEFYPEYPIIVRLARELRVHYDQDVKPFDLLFKKWPFQEQEVFDYALSNYRPVTTPFWGKAENSLNRIWNKDNYSITWHEDDVQFKDHTAQDYFEKGIPFHRNIFAYLENIASKETLRDPNAVIVVKPSELPFKLDEDQNLKADQSELIKPVPVIYESKQIVSFIEDVEVMVLLHEKSWIKFAGKLQKVGLIFEFYDDENIWKITQIGDKTKYEFKTELFYNHGLGRLPARKLRGVLIAKDGLNYFESYFRPAVPNLDDALVNSSTLQMSIFSHAFPQRWEVVDKCNAPGCVNGQILEDGKEIACTNCNGTARKSKRSPVGVHEITLPTKLDAGVEIAPTPSFGYVAPGTDILEFLKDYVIDLINKAFAFLNIDVSNSRVKGSDTALQSMIDREEFFSFVVLFSNQLFLLARWTISTMGGMRYAKSFRDPDLIDPTNFTIRTFKEITEEIATAKEAGIPEIAIIKLLEEYGKARFNTDKKFSKVLGIVLVMDKLIVKDSTDIVVGINNNSIQREDLLLHDNIFQFIQEAILENPDFLNLEMNKIKEEINNKLKERAKETERKPIVETII